MTFGDNKEALAKGAEIAALEVKATAEDARIKIRQGAHMALFLLNGSEERAIAQIKKLAASKRAKIIKTARGDLGKPDHHYYRHSRTGKARDLSADYIDNVKFQLVITDGSVSGGSAS